MPGVLETVLEALCLALFLAFVAALAMSAEANLIARALV